MGTLGHSFRHLEGIPSPVEEELVEPAAASIDDGLGCLRGLAIALLFNAAFVLTGVVLWAIWRWLK